MQVPCSQVGKFLDTTDEILDGLLFKIIHDPADLGTSIVRRTLITLKKWLNKNHSFALFQKLSQSPQIRHWVDRFQFRFQKKGGSEFIDDMIAEFHAQQKSITEATQPSNS